VIAAASSGISFCHQPHLMTRARRTGPAFPR
jgi:hypothetical protein